MVDDDLAYVAPWGFDPARITAPVLLLHGLRRPRGARRATASGWPGTIPSAELWLRPGDGHVSVLTAAEAALDWLLDATESRKSS